MALGIPPAMLGLLCLANLSELFFSLALLGDWIRSWRHVKVYWAYGLGAALAALGFGVLQVMAGALTALAWNRYLPPGWEGGMAPPGQDPLILLIVALLLVALGLLAIVIAVTRVAGFTMLGMHYADVLGHPSFPVLQRLLGARPPAGKAHPVPAASTAAASEGMAWPAGGGLLGAAGTVAEGERAVATRPAGKQRPWRDYGLSTLGVAATAVAYSVLLFRLTSPHVSRALSGLPGYAPEMARTVTPAAFVLALAAALSEELTYRLGIQGFLARYLNAQGLRYWLPVVLSALLWTLQHVGALEPGWVKLAQIFPIGLMLGWLCRRHGVESCILAHALFNLGLLPLSPFLIGT